MSVGFKPGYKLSIRGDFLGVSGDEQLETDTLNVAAELKRQLRAKEWNHRVRMEAINRYSPSEHGVEIIVLPNVISYRNVQPGDIEEVLVKHLGNDVEPLDRKSPPEPVT